EVLDHAGLGVGVRGVPVGADPPQGHARLGGPVHLVAGELQERSVVHVDLLGLAGLRRVGPLEGGHRRVPDAAAERAGAGVDVVAIAEHVPAAAVDVHRNVVGDVVVGVVEPEGVPLQLQVVPARGAGDVTHEVAVEDVVAGGGVLHSDARPVDGPHGVGLDQAV